MTKPNRTTLRYIGGNPLVLFFVASGRSMTVADGDTVDLLHSEVVGLEGRTDFEPVTPPEAPTPTPTPTPTPAPAEEPTP